MPRPAKRSFTIDKHRTSVSLEEPFWAALKEAAQDQNMSVARLVQSIDKQRQGDDGLSSAIRVWLLEHFRSRSKTLAQGDGATSTVISRGGAAKD